MEDTDSVTNNIESGQNVEVVAPRHKEPRLPLPGSLQEIVGSLLFASPTPLSANDLKVCVRGVEPDEDEDKEVMSVYQTCTNREIEEALRGVEKALEVAGVGFRLVCTGGTYRLQTAPNCGRYVRALLKLDRPTRLSRASLETLAIIAYRQPITKAEIEEIRGVGVDTMVKTLLDLQLVRLVGRSELPGHPFLYGTSPLFLEHFGLSSLDQLNEIDPTLPRSDPRARAKLFRKEEKSESKDSQAEELLPTVEVKDSNATTEESKVAAAVITEEVEAELAEAEETEIETEEELTHVTIADNDDDFFIDDTPDEFEEDDDDDDDEGVNEDEGDEADEE